MAALKGRSDHRRICQVCSTAESKYTCPRCCVVYCSVACFKSHSDTCAESFARERIKSELRSMSAPKKEEMEAILRRVEAAHGSDEMWADVVDSGAQKLQCWEPWWKLGALPHCECAKSEELPTFKSLKMRKPKAEIFPFVIADFLFAYIYSLLRSNGDWFADAHMSEFAMECALCLWRNSETPAFAFCDCLEDAASVCVTSLRTAVCHLSECRLSLEASNQLSSLLLNECISMFDLASDSGSGAAEPILFALRHFDSLVCESISQCGKRQKKRRKALQRLRRKLTCLKVGWKDWCQNHNELRLDVIKHLTRALTFVFSK